ncbi:MAG: hypothetical protein U0929_01575 [Planctomycetaceae bacterium]
MPDSTQPTGDEHGGSESAGQRIPTLARPVEQLYGMPLKYRWEVTRRHPYYIQWWDYVSEIRQTLPQDQIDTAQCAFSLLTRIGVSRADYAPCMEFDEIALSGPTQGWLVGGIQLQTYRQLLGLLIAGLPPEALESAGRLLAHASQNSEQGRFEALYRLSTQKDERYDQHTGHPIVRISSNLSANVLSDDVSGFIDQWRGPQSSERRMRTDKYDEYLAVWDRHEGWNAGRYDVLAEQPFPKIAQEMGITTSTAFNQYRSAFEMISGHPYSLPTWIQLFGSSKWSPDVADAFARAVAKRRAGMPRASGFAAKPRARLDRSNPYDMRAKSVEISTDSGVAALTSDIETLISNGRSDEEICDELELKNPEIVAVFRSHPKPRM